VGWFGHPDLVEWLLGSLEAANDARRASGPPTPFEAAAALALQRVLGPLGGGEAARHAAADARAWRAFWLKTRARQPGRGRLRFGKPYTPAATVDELAGDAPAAARAEAAFELAIVTSGAAIVEPRSWVAAQRAAIAAARGALPGDVAGGFAGARLAAK
jgi:hypothetical protein